MKLKLLETTMTSAETFYFPKQHLSKSTTTLPDMFSSKWLTHAVRTAQMGNVS